LFYDRQRGVWVGSVDVGRNPKTGRRIRRKVSDPDKKACREALDELRVILKATGNVPRRDTTVRQLVEDWLANPPPTVTSDITRTKHRDAAVRINAALGHVPALKLDADMVEALLRGMADDGFATKTIVMTRSVLVRSLNRGQRNKLLTQNVASLVPCPRGTVRQSNALNTNQVRRLLADLTPWWKAWVTIGCMLGLRPGELLGLGWDEVDFKAGVIRVRYCLKKIRDEHGHLVIIRAELKTERSKRTIEMPLAVRAALLTLRKVQAADRLRYGKRYEQTGVVLCNGHGGFMWDQNVRSAFKVICAEAGVGDWTPRELRHTFCSILSDAGTDIERIADAMGHANSTVTREVYRHQLSDKTSDAARIMDEIRWEEDTGTGGS